MDKAFSLEFGDVITAEKAYELCMKGIIFNSKAFTCFSPFCDAQVTCCNMNKEKKEMKTSVHFRLYGDHSDKCDYDNLEKETKKGNYAKNVSTERENSPKDFFELKRPKGYYDKKKSTNNEVLDYIKVNSIKAEPLDKLQKSKFSHHYFSINSFVNKFNSGNGYKNRRIIFKSGFEIKYDDFFCDLSSIKIDDIVKYPIIYYQRALIFESRDNESFVVKFENGFLNSDNNFVATNLFIKKNIFDYNKRLLKFFIESAQKNNKVMIYAYSKPFMTKDKKYVNFIIDNLDFLTAKKL